MQDLWSYTLENAVEQNTAKGFVCLYNYNYYYFFFTFLRRLENYVMCGPNFVAYLSLQLELLEPLWLGDESVAFCFKEQQTPQKNSGHSPSEEMVPS